MNSFASAEPSNNPDREPERPKMISQDLAAILAPHRNVIGELVREVSKIPHALQSYPGANDLLEPADLPDALRERLDVDSSNSLVEFCLRHLNYWGDLSRSIREAYTVPELLEAVKRAQLEIPLMLDLIEFGALIELTRMQQVFVDGESESPAFRLGNSLSCLQKLKGSFANALQIRELADTLESRLTTELQALRLLIEHWAGSS